MHTQYFTSATLLSGAFSWLANAQEIQEAQVPLAGCDALACSGATACRADGDDLSQINLVGIAANAVNLTGETQVSLTLVEEGRTLYANAPGLEAYQRTLYVGAPASLTPGGGGDDENAPAACALMLQYQSQTFRIPDESARGLEAGETISCAGILDRGCQERLTSFIASYSESAPQNTAAPDCAGLASHVMAEIRAGGDNFCDQYYSNLVTVTGAPLLSANASRNEDECRPTLPADNRLYRVGSVQTIVEADSEARAVGGEIFGGRQGYTPIITVMYGGGGDGDEEDVTLDSAQFACMQALRASGEVLEETGMAAARSSFGFAQAGLIVVVSVLALFL